MSTLLAPGVRVLGDLSGQRGMVLDADSAAFVGDLVRRFRPRIEELLLAREARHARFAAGEKPHFLAETRSVRQGDWRCAPMPRDLWDRRVEITGPVDRKMIINALNSGASCFMADLEDSNAPSWSNCIDGQVNLRDAVRRTITFEAPETGKKYALDEKTAVLLVRPRGFHLREAHVEVDGKAAPGMLVDFGLYFFVNAKELLARGTGPYFYLPKMESHLEARLWNDVFVHAQDALGVPRGTIKATCLVETLPAAFEMNEILHELREHSAGLNCGRWDYIFSFLKTLGADPACVLPDRADVTMTQPCMRSYTRLVIQTCHRRGVSAMGGMAAQIPIKDDAARNEAAIAKVRADKLREVEDGHDGTWVAHPGLVRVAREVFDAHMPGPNQLESGKQASLVVTEAELLAVPTGRRTMEGLRHNVRVGVQYLESWLRGLGCVPLYDLMEDAATAEISRTQIWQWVKHRVRLDDADVVVDAALVARVVEDETAKLPARERMREAKEIFLRVATTDPPIEFLTLPAYEALNALVD